MTMPLRKLRSIEEVVAAFGGPTALARWCGISSPSSVTNWISDGGIPRGWHYRLHWEAIERGYYIDRAVLDPGWEQFQADRKREEMEAA